MRVLIIHNRYRLRGGEDVVVEQLAPLLRSRDVEVELLDMSVDDVRASGWFSAIGFAARRLGLIGGQTPVRRALAEFKPDVVHLHNIFPLFGTPAVRDVRESGCPAVWTVHNYRLSCLAGTHVYEGHLCELCSVGSYRPGIKRGCYRGSRSGSLIMSRMLSSFVRFLESPGSLMPIYLTDFARNRYARYGFCGPVIPNAIDIPTSVAGRPERGGAVFVGRVSPEKGAGDLVSAWRSRHRLTLVGDGPGINALRAHAGDAVTIAGWMDREPALEVIARSKVLVVPSLGFEGLPTAVIEAYALGTPVVCFADTAIAEYVGEATHGLVVPFGDFDALVLCADSVIDADEREWRRLSEACTSAYAATAAPDSVLPRLMKAYDVRRQRGAST